MQDTITVTATNITAATGKPAPHTRWQWSRQTPGSIFTSRETWATRAEALEVAEAVAPLMGCKLVIPGDEIERRRMLAMVCDATVSQTDPGIEWLRAVTPLADILGGADFAPIPESVYDTGPEMGYEEYTGRMIK